MLKDGTILHCQAPFQKPTVLRIDPPSLSRPTSFPESWTVTSVDAFRFPLVHRPLPTWVPHPEMTLAVSSPMGPKKEFGSCPGPHQVRAGDASREEGEVAHSGLARQPEPEGFGLPLQTLQQLPASSFSDGMPAGHNDTS